MKAAFSLQVVLLAVTFVWPSSSSAQEPLFVLDGVIVAENPAHSIALVRRADAKRARPLRIGQEYFGHLLLEVTRTSALLRAANGTIRLSIAGSRRGVEAPPVAPETRSEAERWIQRDFSRARTSARLEKEIPVILSDTELTPRVEEGEVRGLELLRLPDGTLLSETGLLPGDILRSINGEPLRGLDSLWAILSRSQDADELRVVVERRGEVLRLAYALTN